MKKPIDFTAALNVKLFDIGADESDCETVGEYLCCLLKDLCVQEEDFDSKRPFGNSGWINHLYTPLIKAGFISGSVDSDGYAIEIDETEAKEFILDLIAFVFKKQDDSIFAENKEPATVTISTAKLYAATYCFGNLIKISKKGFEYKGELIEDAGECHKLLVEFLKFPIK
jgi:hypothetical protein